MVFSLHDLPALTINKVIAEPYSQTALWTFEPNTPSWSRSISFTALVWLIGISVYRDYIPMDLVEVFVLRANFIFKKYGSPAETFDCFDHLRHRIGNVSSMSLDGGRIV